MATKICGFFSGPDWPGKRCSVGVKENIEDTEETADTEETEDTEDTYDMDNTEHL